MRTLVVQQNQVDYIGVFAHPALSLWGEGRTILSGLSKALEGYYSGSLSAFSILGQPDVPASQAVVVRLSAQANYRFKFEQVEASLFNFSDAELSALPSVLKRGDEWLRAAVPQLAYKSHVFAYMSHSTILEGNSTEYLRALSPTLLEGVGKNLGSGIIFHADIPERNWRIQLALDHSLAIADGLFVQMQLITTVDQIDYKETLSAGRSILETSLARLGLKF